MRSLNTPFILLLLASCLFGDWKQGSGPNLNYIVDQLAPTAWSVSTNKGINWKIPLPETGQSTPIIVKGKVFLTCFEPFKADTKLAKNIIALCFDAKSGKKLWERKLPGQVDSRVSGCFGDNTGPAAVSDGQNVCFFNASGLIKCFDLDGNLIWETTIRNSSRNDPYLLNSTLIVSGASDITSIKGRHLLGIDFKSGKILWQSECYAWDGLTPIPYKRSNGDWVALIARGGGHVKEPFKEGLSLIDLSNGKELWRYNHKGLMSTQNFTLAQEQAHVFLPAGKHISLDLETGNITKTIDLMNGSKALKFDGSKHHITDMPKTDMKKRSIIQMSNLLVYPYHFFRTYNDNYLGRLNLETEITEYFELPTQLSRQEGSVKTCWSIEGITDLYPLKPKKARLSNTWLLKRNALKNNQGYTVYGDDRSQFSGWGHHSTALPIVLGHVIYVPTMSGLVYVLKYNSPTLQASDLISISDLGKLGDSWSRSSLSFYQGKLYARTIKELICISGISPNNLSLY